MPWALHEPKFGHLLQTSCQLALPFEVITVIESDETCQDFLQTHWRIPNIQENLTKVIQHLASATTIPLIQGYDAYISEDLETSQQKAFFHKQYTLFDLLCTGSQLQVAIFKFRSKSGTQIIFDFDQKLQSHQWSTPSQMIDFETHSDQVGGSPTFLFAFNRDYFTSVTQSEINIRASPHIPNGFHHVIYKPFNSS
jgi:hypothetical protein